MASSESLSLPEDLKIIPVVGKFHLSTHKPDCFPRFTLMFVKQAGHIDREILKTLWASFNKISPSARSMSLAHHQDILTNFCPIFSINFDFAVKSLCKKYKAACNGVDSTKEFFEGLSESLDPVMCSIQRRLDT